MKMTKHLQGFAMLACLSAVPVMAQERSGTAGAGVNVGGVNAGAQASANVTQTAGSALVVKIAESTLTDQAGKKLGDIGHLLISPSGCVDMALLSLDRLGADKVIPIPWQVVRSSGAAGAATQGKLTLVADIDQQKLQQAPNYSVNQISQITQQQTIQQVFNYYGVQPGGTGSTGSQTNSVSGAGTNSSTTNAASVGASTSASQTNAIGVGSSTSTAHTNTGVGSSATSTNTTPSERPGRGLGRPENRPPANRPPTNRPPENRPPQGTPGEAQL